MFARVTSTSAPPGGTTGRPSPGRRTGDGGQLPPSPVLRPLLTSRGGSTMADLYHEGSRQLQDRFDSRRIADRLEQVTLHDEFTENDRAFIEGADMFFLSTADAEGWPDCSYKGGLPGFVRVLDARTLAFPSYDGNGMFRSLGNALVNPRVG